MSEQAQAALKANKDGPWTIENLGEEEYCRLAKAGGYFDPTWEGPGYRPPLAPPQEDAPQMIINVAAEPAEPPPMMIINADGTQSIEDKAEQPVTRSSKKSEPEK